MQDLVRTCGNDSKERFIQAAITIQKWARGRFIRKLLKPYFELYRRVTPIMNVIEKCSKTVPLRNGFYALVRNAAPEKDPSENSKSADKSEIVSQVDMAQEKEILENLHKNNQKGFETQGNQSNEDSFIEEGNQTYKLIMSNPNASNHEGFSIEDDSDSDSSVTDPENEKYFEKVSNDKYEQLLDQVHIEPIAEEDGEESKYAPTPQKTLTTKMSENRAVE